MGVTYAKSRVIKAKINYSFGFSQKQNLKLINQESPGQHWVSNLPNASAYQKSTFG